MKKNVLTLSVLSLASFGLFLGSCQKGTSSTGSSQGTSGSSSGAGSSLALKSGDTYFTKTPYVDLSNLPAKFSFAVAVEGTITRLTIGTRISVASDKYLYDAKGIMTIDSSVLKDSDGDVTIAPGEQTIKIFATKTISVTCLMLTKIITTAQDLVDINKNVTSLQGAYILGNDIDCSSITNFEPLGYSDTDDGTHYNEQFNGVLDGNGYAIKNVTTHYNTDYTTNKDIYDGNLTFKDQSHSSGNKFGFFQEIGSAGIVRNITFSNVSITGRTIVGVVAGLCSGTIQNVVVDDKCVVKMSTHFYDDACDVGVLAGSVGDGATVVNCVAATSNISIAPVYTDYDADAYKESDPLTPDHHVFYNGAKAHPANADGTIPAWVDSNGAKTNGIYAGVGMTYGTTKNSLGALFTVDPTAISSYFTQTHLEANKSKDGPDVGQVINCGVAALSELKKASTYASYEFPADVFNIKDGALPGFKAVYPYLIAA